MKSTRQEQPDSPSGRGHGMLILAGIYNLAWGLFAVLHPLALFQWAGFDPLPNYPEFWQCLGMVIGVYGIGYLIAASDPRRHWPIVLVGLLGKVFGPIGFVWTASHGRLPWSFGATLLTNDLIWWIPFGIILWDACVGQAPPAETRSDKNSMSSIDTPATLHWTDIRSVAGHTLQEISDSKPTLIVFLRHSGCTFCREALADLHALRAEIESRRSQIAIVYQESSEGMRPLLEKYGMAHVEQFSDPDRRIYSAFRLELGSLGQLFNLKTLVRGFKAVIAGGHGFGAIKSNVYQMPGTFLVHRGKVLREFRAESASDRPDYTEMACPI